MSVNSESKKCRLLVSLCKKIHLKIMEEYSAWYLIKYDVIKSDIEREEYILSIGMF